MVRLRPAVLCGAILLAFALALGAAVPAEADDILFRPARLDFNDGGGGILALGDLDGDDILDAALSGGLSNLNVQFGHGDGTFGPAVSYPTHTSPTAVAIGDFDGDGIPDLGVCLHFEVVVFLGLGDGMFGAETVIPLTGTNYRSIALGDLDGDGALDLVVAGDFVSVIRGRGDGTFHPAKDHAVGSHPRSVAIGDLDGDGIPDLAVASQGSDDASILRGVGDGTFGAPESWPAGDGPESVAIGDVDGNGIPDLVVVSLRDGVAVLIGQGDASFQSPSFYPMTGTGRFVTLADLDGNGAVDIVATNSAIPGGAWVFPGHGDGTFGGGTLYRTRYRATSAAVGDLNRDGFLDITAADGRLSVFLGAGPDGLAQAGLAPAGAQPVELALGLLDGDEVPDLVAATEEGVSVLRGKGDGTFEGFVPYAAGIDPVAVAIDDFDRDGEADLVVVNGGSNTVSFLRGRGDATFEDAIYQGAGHNPSSLAVGDFDGDTNPDLAIPNDLNLGIFAGNGDGTFAPPVFYPIGTESMTIGRPGPVDTADFDGDGILDLAVARPLRHNSVYFLAAVAILRGQGDGTFGAARFFKIANADGAATDLALADVDGDGAVDIVAAKFHLAILWGQGDGTFRAGEVYDSLGNTQTVATGDFDGDGLVDVASATSSKGNLAILRNRGALRPGGGTLRIGPPYYGACTQPGAVAVGDLNGDGLPDVAIASPTSLVEDVVILLGAGPARHRPGIPEARTVAGVPPEIRWEAASPSPFRATTTLRFRLPEQAATRLEIYNVLGQRVRTLVEGPLLPGPHAVTWDGRDSRGRAVAPGVYLVRLGTETASGVLKVVRAP